MFTPQVPEPMSISTKDAGDAPRIIRQARRRLRRPQQGEIGTETNRRIFFCREPGRPDGPFSGAMSTPYTDRHDQTTVKRSTADPGPTTHRTVGGDGTQARRPSGAAQTDTMKQSRNHICPPAHIRIGKRSVGDSQCRPGRQAQCRSRRPAFFFFFT